MRMIDFDPSSTGLRGDVGERAKNTATGTVYIKTGTSDTAWTTGSSAYGGGSGLTEAQVRARVSMRI